MIIDFRVRPPHRSFCHLPIFSPRPDPLDEGTHFFQRNLPKCRSFEERSIDAFVTEMDQAGIDVAVVMGRAVPSDQVVDNADVLDLVETHPSRFVGVAGVDGMSSTAADVRVLADQGFRGIAMDNPWSDSAPYDDDERLSPIYEAAGESGLFVALTTGPFLGASLDHANPDRIDAIAARHADTTFVSVHGNYPWVAQAAAVLLRRTNVYLVPDFYGHLPGMPGSEGYWQALNTFGRDRIMYASSYPIRYLEESVSMAESMPFATPLVRSRFFSENAARLVSA